MVSFTVASAFSVLAATAIQAAPLEARSAKKFTIEVIVPLTQSNYSGQQLQLYHVGAGENAIALTNNNTDATIFELGNPSNKSDPNGKTELHTPEGLAVGNETLYYFLSLTTDRPYSVINGKSKHDAPAGYHYVNANQNNTGSAGFKMTSDSADGNSNGSGGLQFTPSSNGPDKNWASFAVCAVKGGLDGNDGVQFLWRGHNVKADTTGQCEDVSLYTIAA